MRRSFRRSDGGHGTLWMLYMYACLCRSPASLSSRPAECCCRSPWLLSPASVRIRWLLPFLDQHDPCHFLDTRIVRLQFKPNTCEPRAHVHFRLAWTTRRGFAARATSARSMPRVVEAWCPNAMRAMGRKRRAIGTWNEARTQPRLVSTK